MFIRHNYRTVYTLKSKRLYNDNTYTLKSITTIFIKFPIYTTCNMRHYNVWSHYKKYIKLFFGRIITIK